MTSYQLTVLNARAGDTPSHTEKAADPVSPIPASLTGLLSPSGELGPLESTMQYPLTLLLGDGRPPSRELCQDTRSTAKPGSSFSGPGLGNLSQSCMKQSWAAGSEVGGSGAARDGSVNEQERTHTMPALVTSGERRGPKGAVTARVEGKGGVKAGEPQIHVYGTAVILSGVPERRREPTSPGPGWAGRTHRNALSSQRARAQPDTFATVTAELSIQDEARQ